MPFRSHVAMTSLALGLALVLAGCASRPGSGDAAKAARPRSVPPRPPVVDYSPKAVEARTESHAHYAAAILHDLNDEPEAAADHFLEAALADLSNESLVLEASTRLLRAKKAEKAIDLLTRAASRPDVSGAILARLGLAYSATGKKDLAIEACQKAIKKAPGAIAAYQYLAQLHLQSNAFEEGLKVLDAALKQPNPDAAFLLDLADSYRQFARAGKADVANPRALEALDRAGTLKPDTAVLMHRLAEAYEELRVEAKAAEWYARLLARFPAFPELRGKLLDIYIRAQDYTNALPQLQALVRDMPTNPQYHFQLGALYFMQRKMAEAVECFRKTILIAPQFERAYYDLAAAQINLDRPQEALETLDKARERFQAGFTGEYYAGQAYSRMKDYTNALKRFTAAEIIAKAEATNELTAPFFFQIGAASERTQKFKEAEDYFRKCLRLEPDFAEALNYLGYMWAERGENLAEARTMIEKALKLEPKNGAYLDSLGWVLFKLDQPREALSYILKAIEHTKEPDATLYDHLGDIYAALQQPAQAREAWQKANTLEPSPQIRKKLDHPGARSDAPDPAGRR